MSQLSVSLLFSDVMCPDLVGVDGGEVDYYLSNVKNKFQGVAVYTCDKGYALTTEYNEVVCRSWEQWSAALPTCKCKPSYKLTRSMYCLVCICMIGSNMENFGTGTWWRNRHIQTGRAYVDATHENI